MAAEPSAKLDYRSRCLVGQIVEHVKSQGIFDQFRRDCIDELEQRESYRQLKQRVESHVATFLSKQTWTDALPKNQVRDSLRRHINQSEVLERGVKQLISQALESKAKSFQTRIEGVVQNYIYTQHHPQNQDKQNRRYKASEEKAETSGKPSTSEAKQNVVNDITQLIPVPRAGEIGIKTDGHASLKGKAVVQEVVKSGTSASKSAHQPKRTTHGLPTAPVGREGRNVGSPLFVEKDNASPSEAARVQDEKSKSFRIVVENVCPSETSNDNEHRVKALDEVNLKMEPEETSSSKSNEKPGSRKIPESNETTVSFLNAKSADKVEFVNKVGELWVTHTIPIKEAADVPITVIKSEFKTATEEIDSDDSPIQFGKAVDTGDEEKNKTEVLQDDAVAENINVNMADGKVEDTVEERIEEIAVQSSSEMAVDEFPAENSVLTMDSRGPVCSAQAQTVVTAEGQSLSPVCEEHVKTDAVHVVSDEPSVFVSTKEDWERVSSTGEPSDGESDISEVSSVHTSDLSSFDEEVSCSSGSYDDDDVAEQKEEATVSSENKNEVELTNEIPAQGEQPHPNAPTRRRSTRISSRRSTKEEEEEEDGPGNHGQGKSRESPRRKRRGRRRMRESVPRTSEGQSESSPVMKRRRGRPRKNERRISSSSENQRRHSRWHSHGESSEAATDRSSGHNKESSRRKRSQRKIKRTRCYSPSSEGTREVFLPCKRSRVGSKD